jgi:signal peptidase II
MCIAVITTFLLNFLADRITKILAVNYLSGKPPVGLLNRLIIISYTENSGAFLGFGSTWPVFLKYFILIIIPCIVCLAVLGFCFFREKKRIRALLLTTIIAGGMGNLTDRLVNNFMVIDFLNFGIGNFRTGILNIADISITFGAILLILYELIILHRHDKTRQM